MNQPANITLLLEKAANGDSESANRLFSLVYEQLRQLAKNQMAHEQSDHTLQPTALVHEVWVKLVGKQSGIEWLDRKHFIAAAAQAMRRILVDSARTRLRKKRGGEAEKFQLRDTDSIQMEDQQLLDLDEALARLKTIDPAKADLVELRYFVGLTNQEAAAQLGISTSTAERNWRFARAWLKARMEE